MGEKETVSDWGVHLLRQLQILTASFPEQFPPDDIVELKCDCFHGGLPKWLKALVAHLKVSANEKTYSDSLWVVWEAEKEKAVEASQNPAMASKSKLWATSFFPLQKFKGSQLAITPSTWVAHLEEKCAIEEEGIDGNDPDSIEGITEKLIVHLTRAVKEAEQAEKHYYHCNSPDHFIHNCPQLVRTEVNSPLNQKEETVPRKGAWDPKERWPCWRNPGMGHPRHKMPNTDSLLESQPL